MKRKNGLASLEQELGVRNWIKRNEEEEPELSGSVSLGS